MKIAVCGSTGSIGESTLEVVRRSQGQIKILGLAAHSNKQKLFQQCDEFKPKYVAIASETDGEKIIEEMVTAPEVETVVMAIVGFAALKPTLLALKAGKRVALANKEALVTCGELLTQTATQCGGKIIPVDSEHNALFQALQGHSIQNVRKLWITGSGGPFYGKNKKELESVSVSQALNHPRWKMGHKITIDSATLMNKGLEYIEARWLFDISPKNIDIVIHPQSLIHGLVEFIDGSMLAHLSTTDMKAAISYALYFPNRQSGAVDPLDLVQIGRLDFKPLDYVTFPCVKLALNALDKGGTAPTVLNAANEIAVNAFLAEKITFLKIPDVISSTLDKAPRSDSLIDNIFEADSWARKTAQEELSSH